MPTPSPEPIRITAREFQLVLLRRMADFQPELVEKARGELGATITEMREVNAHWQRMQRSRGYRGGLTALRRFLGEPVAQLPRRIGDLSCQATHWKLSLWPDLRYEALSLLPAGQLLAEMLVRAADSSAPRLESVGDVTPWSCVIGDVERAFAPVRHREGSAPSRWTTVFTAPGEDGAPVEAEAQFVYGLVQTVRVGQG